MATYFACRRATRARAAMCANRLVRSNSVVTRGATGAAWRTVLSASSADLLDAVGGSGFGAIVMLRARLDDRSGHRACGLCGCRQRGTGEMRRQELSGSVQRRGPFVKDRVIGLEDVGHPRGDVERDLDVGGGGLSREADGVVEENLVDSGLDDQGGSPDRSAKIGLMRPRAVSCPAV